MFPFQEKEVPKSSDGQLSLRVIRGMDLQETGVLKYQDPFLVIETSRTRFETQVAKGAGSDPEWKEAFEFEIAAGNAALSLKRYKKSLCCQATASVPRSSLGVFCF